jgi:ubiquinone/menaquinone biosynthesis C-methylase UbiE
MTHEPLPHSGHYFGDQRDFWWNFDFLELMAKRWNLKHCRSVLDVGCGVGHWGLTLAPFLSSECKVEGIDPEEQWIKTAKEKANQKKTNQQFQYQVGSAEKIPFEDNSFDMVTCQTVLIHLADVSIALKEMIRVLKPGGLLAVAEPNNIAPMLVFDNFSIDEPIDSILEHIRFQMMCERGKKALGLGYNSIGDLLPGYFSQFNLEQIQVYLSDKTSPLIPPYSSKEEKVLIEQSQTWRDQEIAVWPREETKRYFLASGGSAEEFELRWTKMLNDIKMQQKNIKNKTLCSPGTCIMYLISGYKTS